MSDVSVIYQGNDMVLELSDLTNTVTGGHLNSAMVDITLQDASGNPVAGESWPKTMAYVAASDGVYRVTLPDTLTLTANARYKAIIDANAGAGFQGHWEKDLICKVRK